MGRGAGAGRGTGDTAENELGAEAGVALAEALKSNDTLHTLDMWSEPPPRPPLLRGVARQQAAPSAVQGTQRRGHVAAGGGTVR